MKNLVVSLLVIVTALVGSVTYSKAADMTAACAIMATVVQESYIQGYNGADCSVLASKANTIQHRELREAVAEAIRISCKIGYKDRSQGLYRPNIIANIFLVNCVK